MSMKLRKSMWQLWVTCPRLYEQKWLKNRPYTNSVEMQYGRKFHELAKHFFEELNYSELRRLKQEKVVELFSEFVPRRPSVLVDWMKNFVQHEAKRWNALLNKYRRRDIALWYFRPFALDWHFETDEFEFTIDRVDRYNSGLVNIEYKTGKTMKKNKLRIELTWYNIGVNSQTKFKCCTHIGYFNPQLNTSWIEPVKPRIVKEVMSLVESFRRAQEQNIYPCDPSNFCRYCPYFNDCPCWR